MCIHSGRRISRFTLDYPIVKTNLEYTALMYSTLTMPSAKPSASRRSAVSLAWTRWNFSRMFSVAPEVQHSVMTGASASSSSWQRARGRTVASAGLLAVADRVGQVGVVPGGAGGQEIDASRGPSARPVPQWQGGSRRLGRRRRWCLGCRRRPEPGCQRGARSAAWCCSSCGSLPDFVYTFVDLIPRDFQHFWINGMLVVPAYPGLVENCHRIRNYLSQAFGRGRDVTAVLLQGLLHRASDHASEATPASGAPQLGPTFRTRPPVPRRPADRDPAPSRRRGGAPGMSPSPHDQAQVGLAAGGGLGDHCFHTEATSASGAPCAMSSSRAGRRSSS